MYKTMLESITETFLTVDSNFIITYCNQTGAKLSGVSSEDVTGKDLFRIFPYLIGSEAEKVYKYVMDKKVSRSFVYNNFSADKYFEINVYPFLDGLAILEKDITAYKKEELSRRYTEHRYQQTLDSMMEGCAIFDFDWRYLYVNNVNAKHARHPKEDLIGRKLTEVFPGIEKTDLFRQYQSVMQERRPLQIVSPFTFEDNFIGWFEIRLVPVPEGVFLLSIDITERKKDEEALQNYQSIFKQAEKLAHLGAWWIEMKASPDFVNDSLYWSDEVFRIFGYNPGEVDVTQELFYSLVHPDDRKKVMEAVNDSIQKKTNLNVEHRVIRSDGTERVVWESGLFYYNKAGQPYRLVGAVLDITEFKKAEQLVEEERDKLNTIIDSVPDEIWVFDSAGNLVKINKAVSESLGIEREDVVSLSKAVTLLQPKNSEGETIQLQETPVMKALKGEIISGEEILRKPVTGEWRHRRYSSAPIKDKSGEISGVVSVASDITAKKNAEEKMSAALKEKDLLLKELYHRTKNNMQIISSLLGLQAGSVDDPKLHMIVDEMKNRINAMALVHQKLYDSQNLSQVNMKEYISDLAGQLEKSYSSPKTNFTLQLDLENINLMIDNAIPCGLIINELISNSIKYAFPGKKKGTISVSLKASEDNMLELKVKDDGVGFAKDESEGGKLGLQLFHLLAEDQLGADVELNNENGVEWTVVFRDSYYENRI